MFWDTHSWNQADYWYSVALPKIFFEKFQKIVEIVQEIGYNRGRTCERISQASQKLRQYVNMKIIQAALSVGV